MADHKDSPIPPQQAHALADGLRRVAPKVRTTEGQHAVNSVADAFDLLAEESAQPPPKPSGGK